MSAKSIGLKSVISVDDTKDYFYPSIQISDDNQIIQARESNYETPAELEAEIDALELKVATLNTDSQALSTNTSLLKTTLDGVISDVDTIDSTESSINSILNTISQKLDSGDFEPWTPFYAAIDAKTSGIYNQKQSATDEGTFYSYYFQPDLLGTADENYEAIQYFPSISYSLPTDTDSVPMLLQWNIQLQFWDSKGDIGFGQVAQAKYIQATGMLGVYLSNVDETTIYYQTKDGNFNYDKDDDDNTIVSGCGSSIIDMPTGNQEVRLGFFVSSHNPNSSDFPIESITSWIVDITKQNFNIYSLMRV